MTEKHRGEIDSTGGNESIQERETLWYREVVEFLREAYDFTPSLADAAHLRRLVGEVLKDESEISEKGAKYTSFPILSEVLCRFLKNMYGISPEVLDMNGVPVEEQDKRRQDLFEYVKKIRSDSEKI